MKIDSKKIREIAKELECGMKVFLNKKTLEIQTILDWDTASEDEFWEKEERKIRDEGSEYYIITKMESWEAFRTMEDFSEFIDDEEFAGNLRKILTRKSPFANFKAEIESSPYRQDWFDFKLRRYEDYVREILERENLDIE